MATSAPYPHTVRVRRSTALLPIFSVTYEKHYLSATFTTLAFVSSSLNTAEDFSPSDDTVDQTIPSEGLHSAKQRLSGFENCSRTRGQKPDIMHVLTLSPAL